MDGNSRQPRLRDGVTPGSTIILPRTSRIRVMTAPTGGRPRSWRLVWILLFVVLPALLVVYQVNAIVQSIGVTDARPAHTTPDAFVPYTMLIVGVDERADDAQAGVRSDTLMLIRVNPQLGSVSLLSIPRDTRVEIRGRGPSKINAAYAHGYQRAQDLFEGDVTQQESGMALAAETVDVFAQLSVNGVPVDYITQVNFAGFANLIDALGGITVDVPKRIVDEAYPTDDYGTMRIEFVPGPQRLNGERALIYARTRHADNDFGRNLRQLQVVYAVLSELQTRGVIGWGQLFFDAPQVLGGTVKTTIPFADPSIFATMVWSAVRLDLNAVVAYQLSPQTVPNYQTLGSDLLWDSAGVQQVVTAWVDYSGGAVNVQPTISEDMFNQVRVAFNQTQRSVIDYVRTVAGLETREPTARIQVFNAARVAGIASRISEELTSNGFLVDAPTDFVGEPQGETIIYDVTGHPQQAAQIAQLVPGRVVIGLPPTSIRSSADIIVLVGTDSAKP
ncbi:MAG: LCP family protein [Roseiflexaceae bacterium]